MSTMSDAVDCIELESGEGIGSASGTVGDAQQSAAVLALDPQAGFAPRSRVTGPLLRGTGEVPTRRGVAACAVSGPCGP